VSELEDAFGRLLGYQPTDEERQRLYSVRGALKLKPTDALWSLLRSRGARRSAGLGVTALTTAPANLRGRLVACGHGGAGTPMAYVIDEATKRLVVVPLAPDAGAWSDRTVTLNRDAKGRLLIRPDGLARGV
jgi:hypothetical protein